ncbi:alpha/beta hydrolase [Streptomyces sp. NPDC002994]|uniref:alpha/beta hydrolase n=1 Tax=Streptomyces sp. NPDC002994 TaxID=3154441 RepID=UPI0033AC44E2
MTDHGIDHGIPDPTDPLTPRARALCDAMSAGFPGPGDAEALRAASKAGAGPPVRELDSVSDDVWDGVPIRLYRPHSTTPDDGPLIVFFHGGGWVLCDLDTHDGLCRELAARTGAPVVSAGYRLAPEHRFPAAADDAYTVVQQASARWSGPIVVAGDSSGGNLAAVTALRAPEAIAAQLLFYPALDHRLEGVSAAAYATGFFHTTAHMRWYWEQYLGPDGDPSDPHASPGLAPTLTGLPPALIVLADCDPLRDEGLAYARRLAASGVRAEVRLHPGMFHGFLGAAGHLPEADAALDSAADWLGRIRTLS